jgi:hypothetical protein
MASSHNMQEYFYIQKLVKFVGDELVYINIGLN